MARRTTIAMPDGAEIVQVDMHEAATLIKTLAGIDIAYYFIHSIEGGRSGLGTQLVCGKKYPVVRPDHDPGQYRHGRLPAGAVAAYPQR